MPLPSSSLRAFLALGSFSSHPWERRGQLTTLTKTALLASSTVLAPLASWPFSSWPPHYSHLHHVTTFNPGEGQLLKYNQCSGVQKDLQWLNAAFREHLVYLKTLKVTNHLMRKAGTGTHKGEAENPRVGRGKKEHFIYLEPKEERKRIQCTYLKCLHTWLV